jgi:hypothetical protein
VRSLLECPVEERFMGTDKKTQASISMTVVVRQICMLFALILLIGCTTANAPFVSNAPQKTTYTYSDSYNRVWGVVTSALHSEDLSLHVIDKDSGVMSGVKRLEPSTMDMLMNYSARLAVNVSVQRIGNGVEVRINSINERKHEEHDWRPAGAADAFSATLFEAINRQLSVSSDNSVTSQPSSQGTIANTESNARAVTPDRQGLQKIQTMLNDLGYSAGVADGIMGKNTSSAIKAFQQDHGLNATGSLDDQTVEKLKAIWVNS